jgi:magnesium chelatase family protein
VAKYLARLSGPLLDRIDVQVEVCALPFETWAGTGAARREESSAAVRARVTAARLRQRQRFASADFAVNALIPPQELRRHCALDAAGLRLLESAARKLGLSARSLDRVLRVARTIADLEGAGAGRKEIRPAGTCGTSDTAGAVDARHLAEAMQYRGLDRLKP